MKAVLTFLKMLLNNIHLPTTLSIIAMLAHNELFKIANLSLKFH